MQEQRQERVPSVQQASTQLHRLRLALYVMLDSSQRRDLKYALLVTAGLFRRLDKASALFVWLASTQRNRHLNALLAEKMSIL